MASASIVSESIVLIPARMASSRLPGKPLADIGGKPMILHVLERARAARAGAAWVATDSREVLAAVEAAGGQALMTRADHPSGSDRIFEALEALDPGKRVRTVVNLQGDLPAIEPETIAATLALLDQTGVDLATAAAPFAAGEAEEDPNLVKVIGTPLTPRRLRALYFTRAVAPFGAGPRYQHIGIYAYRRAALERFVRLPPSALEQRERLEQLRALEAGMRIDVAVVDAVPLAVDTPADLERARASLSGKSPRRTDLA